MTVVAEYLETEATAVEPSDNPFQVCDEFPASQLLDRFLFYIAAGYLILDVIPDCGHGRAAIIYVGLD